MKNLISAVSLWFPVNKKAALRLLFKLSLKLLVYFSEILTLAKRDETKDFSCRIADPTAGRSSRCNFFFSLGFPVCF